METPDIAQLERNAGRTAANILRGALRAQINTTFKRRSGALQKTNVTPRYRDARLDRMVISSPHYSFKHHFGSAKKGQTGSTRRGDAHVKAFTRHVGQSTRQVKAHVRKGGRVNAHSKGIDYKSTNHISKGLKATNALEVLGTSLAENRAVLITSQIDF